MVLDMRVCACTRPVGARSSECHIHFFVAQQSCDYRCQTDASCLSEGRFQGWHAFTSAFVCTSESDKGQAEHTCPWVARVARQVCLIERLPSLFLLTCPGNLLQPLPPRLAGERLQETGDAAALISWIYSVFCDFITR